VTKIAQDGQLRCAQQRQRNNLELEKMTTNQLLSSALILVAAACSSVATEDATQPAIATNAIATNAIATNGLAGQSQPGDLQGSVTRPEVVTGLEDPDAQMFMSYLVSCALRPDQSLHWQSRFNPSTSRTWTGNLGLCPQWLTSAPSTACLERVSACLLARNNVFGVSVPVSLRGRLDDDHPIALADDVGLWPLAWRSSTPVASASACSGNEVGVTRNCGWSGVGVGRCTPGETVHVGAGCGLGSSNGNTMLRVCTRIHFCDDGSPEVIAQDDGGCGNSEPRVEFSCPSDGFYAVMAASHASNSGPPSVSVAADPPSFPSSEAQAFTWREGAFYGNIFAAGALNPLKPQVRVNPQTGQVEEQPIPGFNFWVRGKTLSSLFAGVVYLKMWACSSGNWSIPDAYYERRMCAGVGGINCAAKYAGACGLVCGSPDAAPAGDLDYGDCADLTLHHWQSPITPFLNHPCDLLSRDPPLSVINDTLCRTVAALPIPP
jgi:hypothetical protein